MQWWLRRARLAIMRAVCLYRGHRDRLVTYDTATSLGTFGWWYCDRCTWTSPTRYMGPSLKLIVMRGWEIYHAHRVGRS